MKRALVTGSSSGIGLAVANRLLQAGWQVIGVDISPSIITHSAYQHFCENLTKNAAHTFDEAFSALLTYGQIDALVHAAGVMRVGALPDLNVTDGEAMWQLHVRVATQLAQTFVPRMAAQQFGRVVLIGSRVAVGMAGRSQYAASKAALVALARSWAAEVVSQGVTINVVSPAATDTPMLRDPVRVNATPRLPPIGRLIAPEEVSALVAFLLNDEAAAITGQELTICGGSSLNR